MAVSVSISTLNTMTDKFFLPTMRDNFFLNTALLMKLKQREKEVDGGSDIRFPISHSKSTMAKRWQGRFSSVQFEFQDHATQGVVNPRMYTSTIALANTDLAQNKGRAKLVDIIKTQVQLAEESMSDLMDTDAFLDGSVNSDGVRGLDGLNAVLTRAADPSPGAYAGISRSGASGSKASPTGNAFWNANVVAANANGTETFWKGATSWNNSTTLTTAKMQTMLGTCTHGKLKPNLIITSQVLYDKYHDLITTIQRQMTNDELGKFGFQSVEYAGVPIVVADNISNAGYMYFLNMDTFEFKPYADMNLAATPFRYNADQLAQLKIISWMGNMICTRPNANGLITGLTAT